MTVCAYVFAIWAASVGEVHVAETLARSVSDSWLTVIASETCFRVRP